MATNSIDITIRIWNTSTGIELLTLDTGVGPISFNPDDSLTAAVDFDSQVTGIYFLGVDDLLTSTEERVTRSLTTKEGQQYQHINDCPEEPNITVISGTDAPP